MLKKLLVLFFTSLLVFLPSTLAFAQEAPAQNKTAKEVRWEGTVIRSDPDKSTLTVRKLGSSAEMIVHYDSSTHWVSQEHASKKVGPLPSGGLGGVLGGVLEGKRPKFDMIWTGQELKDK